MTGLVPVRRCFDPSETLAERLEAARRRGCGVVAQGEAAAAAAAPVAGALSIAGPEARLRWRGRAHLAGDVSAAAAERSSVSPAHGFARAFLMPGRAAE